MASENPSSFPQYHALRRYCCMLAGTPWDGEDLLQDSIIKVLRAVPHAGEREELPLSYWFRVATNTWIDYCRKRKLHADVLEEEPPAPEPELLTMDIRDAIERLVYLLPPKQAAIVLLVDVYRFTTRETAELLEDINEGAVKTSLRRARDKISRLIREEGVPAAATPEASQLIDKFTAAFARHDPLGIVQAYQALAGINVQVKRYVTKTRISFTFSDPEGNIIQISMSPC